MKESVANCTDQKVGNLITYYELGLLDAVQEAAFETHALECAHCMSELSASAALSNILKDRREEIKSALIQRDSDFATERSKLLESARQAPAWKRVAVKIRGLLDRYTWHWSLAPSLGIALVLFLIVANISDNGTVDDLKLPEGGDLRMRGLTPEDTVSSPEDSLASEGDIEQKLPSWIALLPTSPLPFDRKLVTDSLLLRNADFVSAMSMYASSDYESVYKILRSMEMQSGGTPDYWKFRGAASYQTGEYAEAASAFRRTAKSNDDPMVQFYLAASLIRMDSISAAKIVLAQIPDSDERIHGKASALLNSLP